MNQQQSQTSISLPDFDSIDDLDLDMDQVFKTAVQMLNVGVLTPYLMNANEKISENYNARHLRDMLNSEGIECEYRDLTTGYNAQNGAMTIASIAGAFLMAIAEIKECDEISALAFLGAEFDGKNWSISEIIGTGVLVGVFIGVTLATAGGSVGVFGAFVGTGSAIVGAGNAFYRFSNGEIGRGELLLDLALSGLGIVAGGISLGARLNALKSGRNGAELNQLFSNIERLADEAAAISTTKAGRFAIALDDLSGYEESVLGVMSLFNIPRHQAEEVVNAIIEADEELRRRSSRYQIPTGGQEGRSIDMVPIDPDDSAEDIRMNRLVAWLQRHSNIFDRPFNDANEFRQAWIDFKYSDAYNRLPPDIGEVANDYIRIAHLNGHLFHETFNEHINRVS